MFRGKLKIVFLLIPVVSICLIIVAGIFFFRSIEFDALLLSKNFPTMRGTVFTDRYGRELRFLPDLKGERARWVPLSEIPDTVKNAFLAAEDERFYKHHGFDPIAILRAAWSNLAEGRIVSGASTISQQVVRLAYCGQYGPSLTQSSPLKGEEHGIKRAEKKTFRNKLTEIVRSVRMEQEFTKNEILEQYLNRAPMGNNLVGVETAARAYFGIPAQNLSASEAALLASLPKAPGILNPYGSGYERLMKRRNWVLARMQKLGFLTPEQYALAREENPRIRKLNFVSAAPHVVDMLLQRGVGGATVTTTIDLDLQQRVQEVLVSHADRLRFRGATQAAAVVIHNPTMEVLAAAGSIEYSEKNSGFNNGVSALRSAGSSLKPFLYALAIESGHTATTLLQDTERKYRSREGQYSPLNFDRKEYGPVTMRAALGNSLNLSAVKMLERVGEARFYDMLKRMNLINHPQLGPEHYGLGMAIGNPEVSPEQLAAAFAMLANGGVYRRVRYVLENGKSGLEPATEKNKGPVYREDAKDAKRGPELYSNIVKKTSRSSRLRGSECFDSVFSNFKKQDYILLPQTAYIITDILSDPTARLLTFNRTRLMTDFPFKVAIKTGTSTFFRDLWAAGYTSDYTVVAWVGNFDGSPTRNLSGSSAAVPIFADIMTWLYRQADPAPFQRPNGVKQATVCGYSGMKPTPHCTHTVTELFIAGAEPSDTCTFHTENVKRHELGALYAGWLYDKNRTGSAGRFRLSGFGDNLSNVFNDPWEGAQQQADPGIRTRNTASVKAEPVRKEFKPEPAERHYRIGDAGSVPEIASLSAEPQIRIIYPLDRDRFVVRSHERDETIKLQAVVAQSVPYIDWFVNGQLLKRTGPPYQAYWLLEEGKYTITAVLPSNAGDSVRVTVE